MSIKNEHADYKRMIEEHISDVKRPYVPDFGIIEEVVLDVAPKQVSSGILLLTPRPAFTRKHALAANRRLHQ